MDPQQPFAEDEDEEEDQEKNTDYFASGSICAVAADVQSNDPFFFVTTVEGCYAECDIMDDYKNIIPAGQMYLSGHYLEKESRSPKGGNSYRIYDKKIVYFYSESIIFPFVPFEETHKGKKNTLFLSNEDYCDIYFTEETKMAAIV